MSHNKGKVPCAACGAEHWEDQAGSGRPHYSDMAGLTIGGEKVYLCRATGGRGVRIQGESNVKLSCARKILEERSKCPGCGTRHAFPGDICEECLAELEAARERKGQGAEQVYLLLYSEAAPVGMDYHDKDRFRKALLEVLGGEASSRDFKEIIPKGSKIYGYSGPSGTPVSLSPGRVEALETMLKVLNESFQKQRVDGRKEGRSLIVGLASGELTVDQFNEKDKKLEG